MRRIYKKQLQANPDTTQAGYPVGTIIVKEIQQNGAVTELTGMVKRGGAFNTANNGWEWFTLDPATSGIMARGSDLMSGMCNGAIPWSNLDHRRRLRLQAPPRSVQPLGSPLHRQGTVRSPCRRPYRSASAPRTT